jgi:dipeptidyl aminopeptidase/acylaminoacyl peptidase
MPLVRPGRLAAAALAAAVAADGVRAGGLEPGDLHRLRAVGEVALAPDGTRVAYTTRTAEGPGAPQSRAFVRRLPGGSPTPLGEGRSASSLTWSPDGSRLAYLGPAGGAWGVVVTRRDGTDATLLASVTWTNHPLPGIGDRLAWSPDGRRIAFVSAAAGPEAEAAGDPMVITRYLYKPTASEGRTRFNDNRRLHLFVVDVATRQVRQITDGVHYEHSPAWSPRGDEILFVSNREPDLDRVFNYDVFAVRVADGSLRRLTETRSAEYSPTWSPDGARIAFLGTKRPLTSSETTMEDDHVWVMDADGANRREVGAGIDNRQGPPAWSADGGSVYFTVQERGSVRLYRLPVAGGAPEVVVPPRDRPGVVGSWSVARDGSVACSLATPEGPAELFWTSAGTARRLTELNQDLLGSRSLAVVEPFTFRSHDGTEIEALLTHPLDRRSTSRHPLIAILHGGPHAQQGPAFHPKAQVYAANGWATLMVNYRGSTGYGQRLADLIFGDQNGGEARDVLAALDAALARWPWLDGSRLGVEGVSYGGQLTNWLVTQTDRFKAAISIAGIANLVSFNYTAYYHDYLAVEFGRYPHQDALMDELWRRSPLRQVARVTTPVLLVHGENDNDVPVAEAEQFYIALKDVGVETVMVRYPREGHGIRETGHAVDLLERSLTWYRRHFARTGVSEDGTRPSP